MKFTQILFLLLFNCSATVVNSQTLPMPGHVAWRAMNWHFGMYGAISFESGAPTTEVGSQIQTLEGCSAISDLNGDLLFYTNGGGQDTVCDGIRQGFIYDKTHNVMPNGYLAGKEGGGNSSHQSSIILPDPSNSQGYYLFTMEESETTVFPDIGYCEPNHGAGFRSFYIDMTLNGGLGDVVMFDSLILSNCVESIAASQHANGIDYWVVVNNGYLHTYLVDESGISEAFTGEDSQLMHSPIKISPNGKYLYKYPNLYSFDNTTGEIGDFLEEIDVVAPSFSPNSLLLYGTDVSTEQIIQFDLTVEPDLIEATRTEVGHCTFGSDLQLAPDGKIYITKIDLESNTIGAILCPNKLGAECNVVNEYFELMEGQIGMRFTNFPDSWFLSNSECGDGIGRTYNNIKENSTKIQISPNPVQNNLLIQTSNDDTKNVTLYNISGNIVSQTGFKEHQNFLNLSHLEKGTYFILIETNKEVNFQKIIKI